ncbi:redox-sensing transcriptional repressor Rex [Euzebya tangerina]|uniref:redox-sensing transcriptional repressor Rex n=1 Tax=Euzebya tangerina TaxID=591198 RepID=UPI000E315DA8
MTSRQIPEASVARLPVYLRTLIDLAETGADTVSSEALARSSGINSAKIRKDLSYLGSYGTRGVGYDVDYLITQISRELGLTQDWATVLVGAGNLGQALANFAGFAERGFRIAAIIDSDPAKHGQTIGGVQIEPMSEIARVVEDEQISIAMMAIPGPVAQDVTDRLVAAGVTSILNFAPAVVSVPEGVSLRKVDLSIELQILAYYEQQRLAESMGAAVDLATFDGLVVDGVD